MKASRGAPNIKFSYSDQKMAIQMLCTPSIWPGIKVSKNAKRNMRRRARKQQTNSEQSQDDQGELAPNEPGMEVHSECGTQMVEGVSLACDGDHSGGSVCCSSGTTADGDDSDEFWDASSSDGDFPQQDEETGPGAMSFNLWPFVGEGGAGPLGEDQKPIEIIDVGVCTDVSELEVVDLNVVNLPFFCL